MSEQIDNLKYLKQKSHSANGYSISVRVTCEMMAQCAVELEALRNQRTEPCEWCVTLDKLDDYLGDHGGMVDVSGFNYCPNCGRRLKRPVPHDN